MPRTAHQRSEQEFQHDIDEIFDGLWVGLSVIDLPCKIAIGVAQPL